ncbi:MAG: NAD-dependent succinate-semialdehyde dehydrogenase [Acidimicrobiia bacterium]
MSTVTSDDEARVVGAVPKQLLIGGSWREGSGDGFAVEDPATNETLAVVADAGPDDAVAALDAAAGAQAAWAAAAPRERAEILRRAYEIIVARADDLALLMTLEMGKPLAESRGEVVYAAEFFRWFSEEAVRIDGSFAMSPTGAGRILTMRQPVGPCLMITPWNFPMAMGTRKIGPAIAAGCTMIVKPAELTPLSMLALAGILEEAGLPKGVLSVLPTSDAAATVEPLFHDPRLRKVSFTGSTEVGRMLLHKAADQVLKVSMELGGNAPFIVFDDADIDSAIEGALLAKMRNIGEACTAANRFLVHAGVADEFGRRLAERMSTMKVGRGTGDGVQVGPLIENAARDKVSMLVDDAVRRGASILAGGSARDGAGYFYEPTVLTAVPSDAEMSHTEIFGPVAPITTFNTEAEAVSLANATEFGLVTYLFTNNIDRAIRVSERLETGMIGLNQGLVSNAAAPFGGVKQSGLGREGGRVGIDEYLETKYLAIAVR